MTPRQTQNLLEKIREERLGGAPREHWVSKNREILLMQVRNTTDAEKVPTLMHMARHLFGTLFPMQTVMVTARAFGVFMLVTASVLVGGLATAQMYGDAMPGENFYGVKVAVEKLQLALAPSEEYRTSLHTEFADRRIDEIARLAESGAAGEAHLGDTLVAFEAEVAALQAGLTSINTGSGAHIAELAKTMERKMAVYQNLLRKAQATVSGPLRHAIAMTRNRVDDASISAMAIIVEKHLQGDADASRAVVVTKFEERLRLAESALPVEEDASSKSTRAKTAIAEAKALIEEENYQAALLKIAEVAELTNEEQPTDAPAVDGEVQGVTDETPVADEPVDSSEEGEAPPQ
jgi:hypothetical protein